MINSDVFTGAVVSSWRVSTAQFLFCAYNFFLNLFFLRLENISLVSLKFNKILLRLADLLDMSCYRVSRPILNHNIEQMSSESAFHWISHMITEKYELETEYELKKEDTSGSYLDPDSIIENVNFIELSA